MRVGRKGLRCYARHGPNGQGSHEDAKVLGDGNERYEARPCRIPASRVRTAAQAVAILQIQPWAQIRWKPSCITHISPYCGSSHVLGPVPLPVTDVIDAQLTPSEHPLMLVAIERCKTLLIIGLNYATRNYIMHAQSCTTTLRTSRLSVVVLCLSICRKVVGAWVCSAKPPSM